MILPFAGLEIILVYLAFRLSFNWSNQKQIIILCKDHVEVRVDGLKEFFTWKEFRSFATFNVIKNDSKNLKKHNSFMGERCFYFTGKYKPEIRNNFVVVIKNKKDEKYLFKTKGPSKKITIKKGMKDCESKHSEGCYVHYSSRIASVSYTHLTLPTKPSV